MADITKCRGEGCDKRDWCYRYTAPESPFMQSWFSGRPAHVNGQCVYFWSSYGTSPAAEIQK